MAALSPVGRVEGNHVQQVPWIVDVVDVVDVVAQLGVVVGCVEPEQHVDMFETVVIRMVNMMVVLGRLHPYLDELQRVGGQCVKPTQGQGRLVLVMSMDHGQPRKTRRDHWAQVDTVVGQGMDLVVIVVIVVGMVGVLLVLVQRLVVAVGLHCLDH